MKRPHRLSGKGFTLIELLLASVAAALILVAIYGVFQHAIHLRDSATGRINDLRMRTRAGEVIRNDLRNALISGGLFAGIVQGDTSNSDGVNSDYPGYLKLTTTTAKDTPDALYGDVQEVEYYIVKDTGATASGGGDLVRAITRDLLDNTQPVAEVQQLLTGVQSFAVSFYDGANWQTSWEFNTADNSGASSTTSSAASTSGSNGNTETLPEAIRVDIQQVPSTAGGPAPAPLEIMVPWTTQPFTSPTPAPSANPT
jgi:prepilin-type N-terminal cleavage/methylation domain-containing protein